MADEIKPSYRKGSSILLVVVRAWHIGHALFLPGILIRNGSQEQLKSRLKSSSLVNACHESAVFVASAFFFPGDTAPVTMEAR